MYRRRLARARATPRVTSREQRQRCRRGQVTRKSAVADAVREARPQWCACVSVSCDAEDCTLTSRVLSAECRVLSTAPRVVSQPAFPALSDRGVDPRRPYSFRRHLARLDTQYQANGSLVLRVPATRSEVGRREREATQQPSRCVKVRPRRSGQTRDIARPGQASSARSLRKHQAALSSQCLRRQSLGQRYFWRGLANHDLVT